MSSGLSKEFFLIVAVDLFPVVNDSTGNLAASLESIGDVAIVGCLLGKLSDRLFAFRAGDSDLVCDLCKSSRLLSDDGSVDFHF